MSGFKPTIDNIHLAAKLWQLIGLEEADKVVRQAFGMWNSHVDVAQVKAKIGVLNTVWEAGVQDVWGWSSNIVRVANESDFDKRLNGGDPTLLNDIASFKTSRTFKPRCNRVAASKYLHFSNPDGFPIWDSVAGFAMYIINGTEKRSRHHGWLGFSRSELGWDYSKWCEATRKLCAIRERSFSYKEIDQYLWLLGYAWDMDSDKEPGDNDSWVRKKLWELEGRQGLLPPPV